MKPSTRILIIAFLLGLSGVLFAQNARRIWGVGVDGTLAAPVDGDTLRYDSATTRWKRAPAGLTATLTVRNSAGNGTCTITLVKGTVTASTC